MGRGRGGGGGRRAPPPAPRRQAPPPANRGAAPAPAQSSGGGFMSSMIQGFAFGTGSSIAREAVHGVMGGSNQPAPEQPQVAMPEASYQTSQSQSMGACAIDNEALMTCLKQNNSNAGACQFYFDALQQCQQSSSNM